MKKFIKERSKVLLVASVLSVLLFVLCIPELIKFSKEVNEMQLLYNQYMLGTSSAKIDTTALVSADYLTLSLIYNLALFGMLMIASAFNIIGYAYKKMEFQLVSIILFIINIFMNLHLFDIGGLIIFSLIVVLNILGCLDYYRIIKKNKKISC